MKKLIASQSKKNAEKVRKRLEGTFVTINIPGSLQGETSCALALQEGYRLLAESRLDEALIIANKVLGLVHDVVDVYLLKARVLLDLEALQELKPLVDELVVAAATNRGVLMVAARYYYMTGQAKKSLGFARAVAQGRADDMEALFHMELCYRYSGETDKAAKILDRCYELACHSRESPQESFRQRSTALFRLANYAVLSEKQLAELKVIYSSAQDRLLRTQAAYALAMQSKKANKRQAEVDYLRLANDSESELLGLRPRLAGLVESYNKKLDSQRGLFPSARPDWLPDVANSHHQPVFILGLPRSGTTLLEQILGCHDEIGQVGESKAFLHALKTVCRAGNSLWSHADYPAYLDKLSSSALSEIVSRFESHQSVLTDKLIYIDKELANFEYVGLMAALLPNARFIHMDRAPMDIFLSCYRNSIPGVPETANPEAIAEYYVYMKKLIGHWRSILPDRLKIINYQSLVREPETFAREAAEFIGVEFDSSMLEFHARKNIVRTLSVDQVRKKIYTTSIEGWREYSDVLEPALKVLEKYNIPLEGVGYLE